MYRVCRESTTPKQEIRVSCCCGHGASTHWEEEQGVHCQGEQVRCIWSPVVDLDWQSGTRSSWQICNHSLAAFKALVHLGYFPCLNFMPIESLVGEQSRTFAQPPDSHNDRQSQEILPRRSISLVAVPVRQSAHPCRGVWKRSNCCRFNPNFRQWIKLLREPRLAKRLVDVPFLRAMAFSTRSTE